MFYENLRINMPRDLSCCLRFFTIFRLGKKNSPYFPFHNVGRSVIVLAISRERCVFHVDSVWTSTRGVRPMWTGGGIKNVIFFGRHKWMAPYYINLCTILTKCMVLKIKISGVNPQPGNLTSGPWASFSSTEARLFVKPSFLLSLPVLESQ